MPVTYRRPPNCSISVLSTCRLVSAGDAFWRRALRQAATATLAVMPGGRVMAHGVEDAQAQVVVGHGVVESIPTDLVGRFHHRADDDVVSGTGRRRGEVPLHLRRHVHRLGPYQAGVRVTE
jgi:hypothetical protein